MKSVQIKWFTKPNGLEEELTINGASIDFGDCNEIAQTCGAIERTFNIIGVPFKTKVVERTKRKEK
jgi:hypothetical protein